MALEVAPIDVLSYHHVPLQARSQESEGGLHMVVGPCGRGGWVREGGLPELPRKAWKLRKYTVFESLRMAQMMALQLILSMVEQYAT